MHTNSRIENNNPQQALACIILAAGKGTRMKSNLPKVLHPIGNMPMIRHVIAAAESLQPDRIIVVIGPQMDQLAAAIKPYPFVIQKEQQGTADAVKTAQSVLKNFPGDILVLYGDTPLVTPRTLRKLIEARQTPKNPAVVVLGMRPENPSHYGRMVTSSQGELLEIVEYLDASPEQRSISLCYGGLMAFDGRRLFELLDKIKNTNVKKEYYLTDIVAIARRAGRVCSFVETEPEEVQGANTPHELEQLEKIFQQRQTVLT